MKNLKLSDYHSRKLDFTFNSLKLLEESYFESLNSTPSNFSRFESIEFRGKLTKYISTKYSENIQFKVQAYLKKLNGNSLYLADLVNLIWILRFRELLGEFQDQKLSLSHTYSKWVKSNAVLKTFNSKIEIYTALNYQDTLKFLQKRSAQSLKLTSICSEIILTLRDSIGAILQEILEISREGNEVVTCELYGAYFYYSLDKFPIDLKQGELKRFTILENTYCQDLNKLSLTLKILTPINYQRLKFTLARS